MTVITIAGPALWLLYNAKYQGDWLDFMRGPYSAKAIEAKTTPAGSKPRRGMYNPGWALIYFTRAAQVDAVAYELGFIAMALALVGSWLAWTKRTSRVALLLWLPLPFYMYSIAWGSIPIFVPQLYPGSYYNSRYGMELLPVLAIFTAIALAAAERWIRARSAKRADIFFFMALVAILFNVIAMMGTFGVLLKSVRGQDAYVPKWLSAPPLVFQEGLVNSTTRIPFETQIATEMLRIGQGSTVMFNTNDHIGAVQDAGIPLKRLISPLDSQTFDRAAQAPAKFAKVIIAIDGDAVAAAVKAHPEGLSEIEVICTTGQGCARFYRSDVYTGGAAMIPFVKAHACGNDFLIVEESLAQNNHAAIAQLLCSRNYSVGADGVEFLARRDDGTFFLRLFNADGSEAELSGNGTRCVAAWLGYSEGLRDTTMGTPGGTKLCRVIECNGEHFLIETSMGIPQVEERTVTVHGVGDIAGAIVDVGNPHFVIFTTVETFASHGLTWEDLGARICTHPDFPKGTNVEFVRVLSPDEIEFRIYERGVGPTQSSGTGTSASAAASIVLRGCNRTLSASSLGGSQRVVWKAGEQLMLTGPAQLICKGEVSLEGIEA